MDFRLPRPLRTPAGLLALLIALPAVAQPTSYLYEGDTLPTQGAYAPWFTTVGPGHPTGYFFGHTTWSSDGDVLSMNTSITPSEGIWFGVTNNYSDPSSFSLANTADGNLVRARLALAPDSSQWSLYWFDASGRGSSFDFQENGFAYSYRDALDQDTITHFVPVADMTTFHTFTSYVLAGQVSYFFDNTYLGGGLGLGGTSNFLLLGDGSATDVSGYGTLRVDSLEIITAVGASAPAQAVPEPSTFAVLAGALALAGAAWRRQSRSPASNNSPTAA